MAILSFLVNWIFLSFVVFVCLRCRELSKEKVSLLGETKEMKFKLERALDRLAAVSPIRVELPVRETCTEGLVLSRSILLRRNKSSLGADGYFDILNRTRLRSGSSAIVSSYGNPRYLIAFRDGCICECSFYEEDVETHNLFDCGSDVDYFIEQINKHKIK